MVRQSSPATAVTLRFRPETQVVDDLTSERGRSENPTRVRAFAKVSVGIRVRFTASDHFSVARGSARRIASKSLIELMRRHERIRFLLGVRQITGPCVLARVTRYPSPYRIQLDITHASEQVPIGIDDRRAISSFP